MDQKKLGKKLGDLDQKTLNDAVLKAGRLMGASSKDIARMQNPNELQRLLSKITSNDLKTIDKILKNPKATEEILNGKDVKQRVSELMEE